jgi:arginine deiminase
LSPVIRGVVLILEALEGVLSSEDEALSLALKEVREPPLRRISYTGAFHPSGIPPQPEIEFIELEDLKTRPDLFIGVDLISCLLRAEDPDSLKEGAEDLISRMRRKEEIRSEDSQKSHIALALPEKEHLEAVIGRWTDYVWKPRAYDGSEAPSFEGWVEDLKAIADALKNEGINVIFYGGDSVEEMREIGYNVVKVKLRKELPKLGYPRDPSVAWSNSPVIMNMTLEHRRGEEDAAADFFSNIGLKPAFRPRFWSDGRRIVRARAEGGNFIVVRGKDRVALFTGIGIRGSNRAAIELIKEYFSLKGVDLDIYGVPLPGYIRDWRTGAVHLDVVMMNAGPCVFLSPGRMGFYSFLKFGDNIDFVDAGSVFNELGVEVDEIPAKGSEITLVNALNIGRGKLVVDAYNEEASDYLEREWGLDVIRVKIPQVEAGGGGVRCASREYYTD